MAAAALAFFLVFPHIPLGEFRSRLDRLNLHMESSQGHELSWQDKLSIYSLGILMGAGGFAFGYPEVAREHLLLYLPGPALRIWKSDFPMGAAAIRRTLKPFAKGLTILRPDDSQATLSSKLVTFRYGRDPSCPRRRESRLRRTGPSPAAAAAFSLLAAHRRGNVLETPGGRMAVSLHGAVGMGAAQRRFAAGWRMTTQNSPRLCPQFRN